MQCRGTVEYTSNFRVDFGKNGSFEFVTTFGQSSTGIDVVADSTHRIAYRYNFSINQSVMTIRVSFMRMICKTLCIIFRAHYNSIYAYI